MEENPYKSPSSGDSLSGRVSGCVAGDAKVARRYRRRRAFAFRLLWMAFFAMPLWISPIEAEDIREFPAIGDATTLYDGNAESADDSHRSIGVVAFAPNSAELLGTVKTTTRTRLLYLPKFESEIRSFDVARRTSAPIVTSLKGRVQMAPTPLGACREPLLLFKEPLSSKVELLQSRNGLAVEIVVGGYKVPGIDKSTTHTSNSFSVAVTRDADIVVLGTGRIQIAHAEKESAWTGDVTAWNLRSGDVRFFQPWEGDQVLAVACSADAQ